MYQMRLVPITCPKCNEASVCSISLAVNFMPQPPPDVAQQPLAQQPPWQPQCNVLPQQAAASCSAAAEAGGCSAAALAAGADSHQPQPAQELQRVQQLNFLEGSKRLLVQGRECEHLGDFATALHLYKFGSAQIIQSFKECLHLTADEHDQYIEHVQWAIHRSEDILQVLGRRLTPMEEERAQAQLEAVVAAGAAGTAQLPEKQQSQQVLHLLSLIHI